MSDFDLQMKLLFIALAGTIAFFTIMLITSCGLLEVNIVQRSTISDGDGTTSTQKDTTQKKEETNLKLLVPLK